MEGQKARNYLQAVDSQDSQQFHNQSSEQAVTQIYEADTSHTEKIRHDFKGDKVKEEDSNFRLKFNILLFLIIALLLTIIILTFPWQDPKCFNYLSDKSLQTSQNIFKNYTKSYPFNGEGQKLQCMDFRSVWQDLDYKSRGLSSSSTYQCNALDYIFDRFQANEKTLYRMTNYNVFLKACGEISDDNPSVQSITRWNSEREVIEWAIRAIECGDKVVLIQSKSFNLLQIIIIAKLVGSAGFLTVVTDKQFNDCIYKNMKIHELQNMKFRKTISQDSLQDNNVVIADNQMSQLSRQRIQQLISQDPNKKLLLYLSNHTFHKVAWDKTNVNLLHIDKKDSCSKPLFLQPTQERGYYSLLTKKSLPTIRSTKQGNSIIKQYLQQYQILKNQKNNLLGKRLNNLKVIHSQSFCLTKQNRKYDGYTVSVYGSRLKGATQEEVDRWESEREPIEWTREKVKPNSAVYYEARKLNLLAITEISRIIAPAKLFVQCEQTDCTRIQKQKQFQSLNNIQIVVSSVDEALKANVIITDNEQIIDKAVAAEFLQKGQMLAYFTRERQTSFKVFAKILPNNRITQIEAYSQECMGYNQKHYFWDIDVMGQFYEIVPSNEYRIFTYWNLSPKVLTPNRGNSLKQFIDSAKVQLKIFNQQTFLLVEGLIPIHQGFLHIQAGHQSDYFRMYMIHSFGGAWADVKHHHYDWRPYFKKLYDDPTKLALGYHEKSPGDVGCNEEHSPPACPIIYAKYREYIGNGEFIYKKNTVLTQEIAARITKTLDTKLEAIKANPPRIVRDYFGRKDEYGVSKYPLRWGQMFGQYTARVAYDHPGVYLYDLPYVLMIDYI